MSRKKNSNDSRHHLKSTIKSPTLEIDLKNFSPNETKKKTSTYHTSIDLTDFIENTPSILRPMRVETVTPRISKNWPTTNNYDDPFISNNQTTYVERIQKKKYYETMAKLDKLLEDDIEEEESNPSDNSDISILSNFTDEMDEKPLKHLDSLISKIKTKSQKIKNDPEKSISFYKKSEKEENFHSKKFSNSYLYDETDETEENADLNTNSLEMQCYRLNRYLEENEIRIESDRNDDFSKKRVTCDVKKSKSGNHSSHEKREKMKNSSGIYQNKASSNNSPSKHSKSSYSKYSIDFYASNSPSLSSPIQRKMVVSSSKGALSQKSGMRKHSPKKNASILCQLDDLDFY